MNEPLLLIILAVQGDDVEKWANILFVVVLAVFWAIGSLVKAKKAQQASEEEQLSPERAPKPSPAVRALRKRLLQQSARPRPATSAPGAPYQLQARQRLSTAVRPQHPITTKPSAPIPPTESLQEPRLAPMIPTTERQLEEIRGPISETVEDIKSEYDTTPTEGPTQEPVVESPLDYDDPEQIRRAILHYEIFGKPLSLREPEEGIIGR